MLKSNSLIFIIVLFIWVLGWRLPGFTQVVTTWDESLYFLIARDWLHNGVLPYTGIFDHKPIGIYLIFRWAIALFGDSVIAIRCATVIFVFLSCCAIYRIAARWLGENAGKATALIYPVLMLGMDGYTSNTELFFPTFILWGVVYLQNYWDELPRINWRALIISGLLFGLAIATKYLVVFEAFYLVGIILLAALANKKIAFSQLIGQVAVISIVACIPTALAYLYYYANHQTDAFIYCNFIANSKHLTRDPINVVLNELISSTSSWYRWAAPAFFIFTISAIAKPITKKDALTVLFLFGWLFATLLEAWVTLKFYTHYYNLTFMPLAIICGWSIARLTVQGTWRVIALGLLLTVFWGGKTIKLHYSPWIKEYQSHSNVYEQIADYINPQMSSADSIYVVNDEPILYFLTKNEPPTRFAYPAFVIDPHFSFVAEVDPDREVAKILAKSPKFVIIGRMEGPGSEKRNPVVDHVMEEIKHTYTLDKSFGRIDVYRKLESALALNN